jgi:hypothetical protein
VYVTENSHDQFICGNTAVVWMAWRQYSVNVTDIQLMLTHFSFTCIEIYVQIFYWSKIVFNNIRTDNVNLISGFMIIFKPF